MKSYQTSGDCIWAGHLGTGNSLFTDGHAKSLRIDKTYNARQYVAARQKLL